MDGLNSCGLKNCGWCRETGGGDRDRPGVVEDEEFGGEIGREGGLVDGGSSGEAESPGSGLGGDKGLIEMEGGREGTEEEGAGEDGGTGWKLEEREVWWMGGVQGKRRVLVQG